MILKLGTFVWYREDHRYRGIVEKRTKDQVWIRYLDISSRTLSHYTADYMMRQKPGNDWEPIPL